MHYFLKIFNPFVTLLHFQLSKNQFYFTTLPYKKISSILTNDYVFRLFRERITVQGYSCKSEPRAFIAQLESVIFTVAYTTVWSV